MSAASLRQRFVVFVVGLLALVLVGASSLVSAGPVSASTQRALAKTALDLGIASPAAQLLRKLAGPAVSKGGDGRVTVLLLGSDFRPSLAGERTDIVIVMTINPNTKNMAAVSIPRDTARLPICGGSVYKGRVNSMFSKYRSALKDRDAALNKMRIELGCTLGVEIDYYALMRMTAFNSLTDNVGGYNAFNSREIKDKKYWDDPAGPRGIYFAYGNTWLRGDQTVLCNGSFLVTGNFNKPGSRCDRAIVYVRTRKGAGNSDFKRTRRAQDVVAGAINRVDSRGNGGNLTSLLNEAIAQRNAGAINTDIPMTAASAAEFYSLLSGAQLSQQAVLAPKKYAARISGTSAYRLKITAVRNLTASWFAPVP